MGFFEGKLAELNKLPDSKSKDFHTYLLIQLIKRKPIEVFWKQLKEYVKEHKKELRAIAKAESILAMSYLQDSKWLFQT